MPSPQKKTSLKNWQNYQTLYMLIGVTKHWRLVLFGRSNKSNINSKSFKIHYSGFQLEGQLGL